MRKSILIATLLTFAALSAQAQIQWASTVEEHTSQGGILSYCAAQAVGEPNAVPTAGDNANAWRAEKGNENSIKVRFANPQIAYKITIVESNNPGRVKEVFLYDSRSNEYKVASFTASDINERYRVLEIKLPAPTSYEVVAAKIVTENIGGKKAAIDAIGIGDLATVFTPKVNVIADVVFKQEAQRLSADVNSTVDDINPLISPDGKRMYFSRKGHPENIGGVNDEEDIYIARYDAKTGKWGKAQNFGEPINNKDPNFVSSVSPDGNMLLLGNVYLSDGEMLAGASVSYYTENGWREPDELKFIKYKNTSERVDYFMSNSRKVLIISANKGKSYGQRDLYASFLVEGNTWTEPFNLGAEINTAADDYAPFLAADERTLYFTTTGHPGYGGGDIFMTRRIGESWTNWTKPVNLGPVVNTSMEEAYFSITAKGDVAYFTSKRDTKKDLDIYRIAMPVPIRPEALVLLSGLVLDRTTGKPIKKSIQVRYENLSTGEEMGLARTNPMDGSFQVTLPTGSNYGFFAEGDGFLSTSGNLNLRNLKEYGEQSQTIFMVQLKKGAVVTLNNIFFDFNKTELKAESYPELKRVANYLKSNPKVMIEVNGHTDSLGTAAYNLQLSKERAEAVKNYLVNTLSISESRIIARGFGEGAAAASNKTKKGRALNRRVEFTIASVE